MGNLLMAAPILVTGAAGFIGHATSHRLLERGEQVVGIDNLNDYYDPALKEARLSTFNGRREFSFERMDIADAEGVAALVRKHGITRVVHLAAQSGVPDIAFDSTERLLDLQLRAAKDALEQGASSARAMSGARDFQQVFAAQSTAAQPGLDIAEQVGDAQAVTAQLLAARGDLEVGLAEDARGRDAGRAGDFFDDALHLERLGLERVEVVAENFHEIGRAHV